MRGSSLELPTHTWDMCVASENSPVSSCRSRVNTCPYLFSMLMVTGNGCIFECYSQKLYSLICLCSHAGLTDILIVVLILAALGVLFSRMFMNEFHAHAAVKF